jgi:hypothetical protein
MKGGHFSMPTEQGGKFSMPERGKYSMPLDTILAPIMMGIALATFNAPPATNPTTIEVVDEEDWMMEVERIPMNKPTNGLVVVAISVSAKPLPNILREVPMSSRLKRNRYKKHRRNMKLNKVT